VAQIYRTWQEKDGQKWINACWYYRPEQTVHRYEKHFFENEVVKTGQYRDHHIDEVVDKCFVMFFTRYNKGRPRGFPADKEVYVCEARYNEDKFKLNKIKTWASCVPDEVRDKDYEMDLFDAPRKMKKVPSPIKHLLREDAKEDDELPKPTWGAANAPPIVGAVHKRPREANESPPPEPTPSPQPEPAPEPVRQHVTSQRPYDNQTDVASRASLTTRSPASTQVRDAYGQQFGSSRPSASPAPVLQHHNSYGSHTSQHTPAPQTPQLFQSSTSYNHHTMPAAALPHNATPNPLASYEQYNRNTTGVRPNLPTGSSSTNAYNPPRPVEVYHLNDSANASIPIDVRAQFHRDEHDRVLFFTAPPLDVSPIPEAAKTLGHSVRYLAAKARERSAAARIKNGAQNATTAGGKEKGNKRKESPVPSSRDDEIKRLKNQSMEVLAAQINAGTEKIYKDLYGADWKAVMDAEAERLVELQEAEKKKLEASEMVKHDWEERKKITVGRSGLF
jgi:chromatin structure-remodeling complex subunit RSC1/2